VSKFQQGSNDGRGVSGRTDGGGRLVDTKGTRVVAKPVHHLSCALGCSVCGGEG